MIAATPRRGCGRGPSGDEPARSKPARSARRRAGAPRIVRASQAGSRRRKLSGDKPSTRLLTPPSVATRCPALFWSLYADSRTDPSDEAAPGDVAFALDHVTTLAMEKYEADVKAMQAAEETA